MKQRQWGAVLKWGLSARGAAICGPERFSASAHPPSTLPPQGLRAAAFASWHRFVLESFCCAMGTAGGAPGAPFDARRGVRAFLASSSTVVGQLFGEGVPGLSRPLDASPEGLDAQLLSPQLRAAIGDGGGGCGGGDGGSGGGGLRVVGARLISAHLVAVDASGEGDDAALEKRGMQRLVLNLDRALLLVTALPSPSLPFWWLALMWQRVFSFVNHGLPGLLSFSRVYGRVGVAYLVEEEGGEEGEGGGEGAAGAKGGGARRQAVHALTWEGAVLSRHPLSWAASPFSCFMFGRPSATPSQTGQTGLASLGVAAGWQVVDVDFNAEHQLPQEDAKDAAPPSETPLETPLGAWLRANVPAVDTAARSREAAALRVLCPNEGLHSRMVRLLGAARGLRAALESDEQGRALLAGTLEPKVPQAPQNSGDPGATAATAAADPAVPVPGTLGERLADIEKLLSAAGDLHRATRAAAAGGGEGEGGGAPLAPFPSAELRRVALDVGEARPPLASFRVFSFWGFSLMWYTLRSPLRALLGVAPSRAADAHLIKALSSQALAGIARTLLGAVNGADESVAPLLEVLRLEEEALAFTVLVHRLAHEDEVLEQDAEHVAEEANANLCRSLNSVASLLRSARGRE